MTAPGTGDAERREDGPPEGDADRPPAAAPSGWGEPSWPAAGAVGYGPTAPGAEPGGQPPYGAPTYGPGATGPTPYGSPPTYGQQPGAAPSGAVQNVAPQYGSPQYGAPQNAAPQQPGAPQYGYPQQSGAPQYGYPQQPAAPQYGYPQQPAAPQYGYPQQPGAPQYGTPQYGNQQYGNQQYGNQQYGNQQYGNLQYGNQPYGGPFRPPPVQPGIIPLRPLSLTELYDGAFRAIRVNPRVMFGFSAVVVLAMSVLGGLTQWALIPTLARTVAGATTDLDPTGQLGVTDTFAASLATVGLIPWLIVGSAVLTGLLTGSVSRSVIGQQVTVAELWQRHWRRTLLLLVIAILQMIAIGLLIALVVAAVALPAVADQPGVAVAVGVVLVPAAVVLTVWVSVRLLLLPPALVLEGNGVVASVRRAWTLTRGSFWRVLGIYLLASVIVGIVGQVLSVPVSIVAAVAQPDLTSPAFIFTTTLVSGLVQAIATVFLAAVVALLYIDLRIRREGLDVELARAAEAAADRSTTGRS